MSLLRDLGRVRGMNYALGACVLGLGVCAWAWQTTRKREALPAPVVVLDAEPGALDGRLASSRRGIGPAVDEDLFSPYREAPLMRYWIPGQGGPSMLPPDPVVLGVTIATGAPSFATVQLGSSALIFASVGDRLDSTYTVKSIDRQKVVFATRTGKTLEILVPTPGS